MAGAHPRKISAILGKEAAGALAGARIAVIPLADLQTLAGQSGRISRILIETKPGAEASVRKALVGLTSGRLTVARADQDLALLHQALGPSDQASGLFAAISALLGFLFAFNAMLLTAPERRQTIADLRVDGTRRGAVAQMVIFQALCLGLAASAVGLLAGYALAVGLFHQSTGYLSQAFTLGSATVVGATPMLIALACGLRATLPRRVHAAARPAAGAGQRRRLRRRQSPGNQLGGETRNRLAADRRRRCCWSWPARCSRSCRRAALAACVLLAFATMLAVPMALAGVMRVAGLLAERYQQLTLVPVALTGLRATSLRSMALAATGAVALFGSDGARWRPRRSSARHRAGRHRFSGGAQLWVISPLDNQATVSVSGARPRARVAALPTVSGVGAYQGSFFDWGGRRPWIIARPANATTSVLEGQILQGSCPRQRPGAWQKVAGSWSPSRSRANITSSVGRHLRCPTPTGITPAPVGGHEHELRLAHRRDLHGHARLPRAFASSALTALGVDLRPSVNIGPGESGDRTSSSGRAAGSK